MSDLRLRPRSVTEIVDAAFHLYKRDALEYVLVSAIAYAPWAVAQLLVLRGLRLLGPTSVDIDLATSIFRLVGFVAYALMSAVLSRFSSDVYLDRPTGMAAVVRSVLPAVPRVVGATILLTIIAMLGVVPVLVGVVTSNAALVALGVVVSIVWFFYIIARFFAVVQILVLENSGVMTSLRRSGVLSRNRKGHILLTLLLVVLIFMLLFFATSIVVQIVGSMAGIVLLAALYTIVAYPLIGITQMLLYYDARIRAEAFDVEMMAGALDAPAATGP